MVYEAAARVVRTDCSVKSEPRQVLDELLDAHAFTFSVLSLVSQREVHSDGV